MEKKISIKEFKNKSMEWNKVVKKHPGNALIKDTGAIISIRHHERKKSKVYCLYVRTILRKKFGGFTCCELYFNKGYLGIKLLDKMTDEAYIFKNHSKKRLGIASVFLKKIKPKEYFDGEVFFDLERRMLVIPIKMSGKGDFENTDVVMEKEAIIVGGKSKK